MYSNGKQLVRKIRDERCMPPDTLQSSGVEREMTMQREEKAPWLGHEAPSQRCLVASHELKFETNGGKGGRTLEERDAFTAR